VKNPKISVIIPVYNQHKEWLLQCLDSWDAQTYDNYEVIVTGVRGDPCLDWAKIYKPKIVDNHYPDAKTQINNGIKFAEGEYVITVGSDDYFFPKALEWLVETLREKNSVLVYSDLLYADENMNTVFSWKAPKEFDLQKLKTLQFMHDSSLVKKSVLWEFGLYDTAWRKFAVWDMWFKIAAKYPYQIHYCPHSIGKYRRHEKALGIQAFHGDENQVTGEELRGEFYRKYGLKPKKKTMFVGNYVTTDYNFVDFLFDKDMNKSV
jgi:glycosyltransferase involved in cell wall biosynthesis